MTVKHLRYDFFLYQANFSDSVLGSQQAVKKNQISSLAARRDGSDVAVGGGDVTGEGLTACFHVTGGSEFAHKIEQRTPSNSVS